MGSCLGGVGVTTEDQEDQVLMGPGGAILGIVMVTLAIAVVIEILPLFCDGSK